MIILHDKYIHFFLDTKVYTMYWCCILLILGLYNLYTKFTRQIKIFIFIYKLWSVKIYYQGIYNPIGLLPQAPNAFTPFLKLWFNPGLIIIPTKSVLIAYQMQHNRKYE